MEARNRAVLGRAASEAVLAGAIALAIVRPAMEMTDVLFDRGASGWVRQCLYVMLLVAAALLNRPWSRSTLAQIIPWPVAAFLAWAALSITWSPDPAFSAKRLSLTVISLIIIFSSTARIGYDRSLRTIRLLLTIALIINITVSNFFPQIGLMKFGQRFSHEEWQGIMGHKNLAGFLSGLTIILFTFGANRINLIWRVPVIIGSLVFIIFSDARTSMIALVLSSIFAGMVVFSQRNLLGTQSETKNAFVIVGGVSACLIVLGLIYLTINNDALMALLSDDTAFSGRTQIWRPMLATYFASPFTGVGYGAFWAPSSTINANVNWMNNVSHAHNGYIDTAVSVGLPGLILALIAVVFWPINYLVKKFSNIEHRAGIVVAILAYCLFYNFGESGLFDRDELSQVFITFAIAMLRIAAVKRRRRRRPSVAEGFAEASLETAENVTLRHKMPDGYRLHHLKSR